jgi:hypothetical protein
MDQVRQRIETWRRTRVRRGRMPEELWRAAMALAREYGVYAVARGLGVNYDSLKARVGGAAKRDGAPVSGFVELSPGLSMGALPAGSVLELVGAGGEKLTIRLAGSGEVDVADLCRDFWSHDR